MKIYFVVFLLSLASGAKAYIPTAESLFRNGLNPEITSNVVEVSFSVTNSVGQMNVESKYYKVMLALFDQDRVRVVQAQFPSPEMSDETIVKKKYFSNFSGYSLKNESSNIEKQIFFGFLFSNMINDGSFMIQAMRGMGVPFKLNTELVNKEKWALYQKYKSYLSQIAKDKSLKETLESPLRPNEPGERAKVESLLGRAMYEDLNQVRPEFFGSKLIWTIRAGSFFAQLDYYTRQIEAINFYHDSNTISFEFKRYWRPNGVHFVPQEIIIKTLSGEVWRVEVTKLRHLSLRESDFIKKLQIWDSHIKSDGAESASFLL